MEKWKPIKNFEKYYEISNEGKVKSFHKKEKVLNAIKVGEYLGVQLSKNGKSKKFYIHRLVAEHFIRNEENKKTVNHKDGNKLNNHFSNLEWSTQSENNIHAIKNLLRKPKTKFNFEIIEKARKMYETGNYSQRFIAKKFGVSFMQMCRILNKKARVNL